MSISLIVYEWERECERGWTCEFECECERVNVIDDKKKRKGTGQRNGHGFYLQNALQMLNFKTFN